MTLATVAARPPAGTGVEPVVSARASAPLTERRHATLGTAAIDLADSTLTRDVAGCRRCKVAAVLDALRGPGPAISAAGAKQSTRVGNAARVGGGDGVAAVATGAAGAARPIADTAAGGCGDAGIDAARMAHAAVHEPLTGMWRGIARRIGTDAPNHAAALDRRWAIPGQPTKSTCSRSRSTRRHRATSSSCRVRVRVQRVAAGGDRDDPGCPSLRRSAEAWRAVDDHARFLSLTGMLDRDLGGRSEAEQKAQATTVERHGRVHMTSTSELMGGFGAANQAATKLGVVTPSKSIARDMQSIGVRSNAVAPFAWTRMIDSTPTETPEQRARAEGLKTLDADPIASFVVARAGDSGAHVTEQVFGVCGNAVYRFSQPRTIRTAHATERWTPGPIATRILDRSADDVHPPHRSADISTRDPV